MELISSILFYDKYKIKSVAISSEPREVVIIMKEILWTKSENFLQISCSQMSSFDIMMR